VRRDPLAGLGAAGQSLGGAIRRVPVHVVVGRLQEDGTCWSGHLSTDEAREPRGASGGDGVNVGAQGLGDASEPIEGQQRDESVIPEPSLDQQGAQIDAIQAEGARLVVDPRVTHTQAGAGLNQLLLLTLA
jgi:hypothetical protein